MVFFTPEPATPSSPGLDGTTWHNLYAERAEAQLDLL